MCGSKFVLSMLTQLHFLSLVHICLLIIYLLDPSIYVNVNLNLSAHMYVSKLNSVSPGAYMVLMLDRDVYT